MARNDISQKPEVARASAGTKLCWLKGRLCLTMAPGWKAQQLHALQYYGEVHARGTGA